LKWRQKLEVEGHDALNKLKKKPPKLLHTHAHNLHKIGLQGVENGFLLWRKKKSGN
jgi:hypothetical protein